MNAARLLQAEWCEDDHYPWLHYDVSSDSAFCHLCMTAAYEGKLIASTKKDPAFFTKGFTYWKEATTAFKEHEASQCLKETNKAINLLPKQVGHIGEMLSKKHCDQKAANKKVFLRILASLQDKIWHWEAPMVKKCIIILCNSFIFVVKIANSAATA